MHRTVLLTGRWATAAATAVARTPPAAAAAAARRSYRLDRLQTAPWVYCHPTDAGATCNRTVCSTRRSRPTPAQRLGSEPDRFLYQQMQAAGNRWLNDAVDQATTPDSKKTKKIAMTTEKAQRLADEDFGRIGQKLASVTQTVKTAAVPVVKVASGLLRIGGGLAMKMILRLEETPIGQRVSVPVRRFLQESCEAKGEREKYVKMIHESAPPKDGRKTS